MNGESFTVFIESIRTEETRKRYKQRLNYFCRNILMDTEKLVEIGRRDPAKLKGIIIQYMRFLRGRVQRKEIRPGTMAENMKPIKLFCEMNDVDLNWKKLNRLIPEEEEIHKDRAYTKEEIAKMLEFANIRSKVMVLTMSSSGVRVGALPDMKVKHVEYVKIEGKIVCGKMRVYADTKDEYPTFISLECYKSIQDYLTYRIRHKEKTVDGKIDLEAPLIRNAFNTIETELLPARPLKVRSIEDIVLKLCYKSGVKVKQDKKHEVPTDHGFRKFYYTQCLLSGMNPLHKEMLIGHSIGLEDNYYRPKEEVLLRDYLKVMPHLTINAEEAIKANMEQRVAESNKKIGELERDKLLLSKRLSKIETDVQNIKKLVGQVKK